MHYYTQFGNTPLVEQVVKELNKFCELSLRVRQL